MSFNKNACKRLGTIAGVNRESMEITDTVRHIVDDYLTTLIYNVIQVVRYSGRKTITVDDIRFLSQITDLPNITYANNLTILTKMCVNSNDMLNVLQGYSGYTIYTQKKPFAELVREIVHDSCKDDLRIGKNVTLLLQNLVEHKIIRLFNRGAEFMKSCNRDTLLAKDIMHVSDK